MKTVTLTYTGPLPDGTIADPHTGATYNFKAGEPVTLPETITGAMIASGNWQEISAKKPNKNKED